MKQSQYLFPVHFHCHLYFIAPKRFLVLVKVILYPGRLRSFWMTVREPQWCRRNRSVLSADERLVFEGCTFFLEDLEHKSVKTKVAVSRGWSWVRLTRSSLEHNLKLKVQTWACVEAAAKFRATPAACLTENNHSRATNSYPLILEVKQWPIWHKFPGSISPFTLFLLCTFSTTCTRKPTVEMPRVTSQTYAARLTIYYPIFAW